MKTANVGSKLESLIGKIGWLIVVAAALALSFYSLYIVGLKYGLPVPLALLVSASYDGAAIVCGDLALRYARTHGDSGLAPRIALVVFALTSSFLNLQHAIIVHDPTPAKVLYAMPPLVAVTVLELHSRYERRGALRRAGRLAKSLPAIGRWTWVFHFWHTLVVLWRITQHRLNVIEDDEIAIRPSLILSTEVSPSEYRKWAVTNGFILGDRGRIPQEVIDAYQAAKRPNVVSMRLRPAITGHTVAANEGNDATNSDLTDPNQVSDISGTDLT